MITVHGSTETTTIIKKSKFVGYACRISDEAQAQAILSERKKKHYDASHNCFAYVLENGVMRYSDDGEPQGTAGLPMLEVIKKSGLSDVLVMTTRYFGGTLLGAGGLARAYTKSASSSIEAVQKVQVIICEVFETTFTYNAWSKAEQLLKDSGFMIDKIDFSDIVRANLSAMPGEEAALEKLVTSISLGKSQLTSLGKKRIERKI